MMNPPFVFGLLGGSGFAAIVAGLFAWQMNKAKTRGIESETRSNDAVTIGTWIENAERQARRIGDLETRLTHVIATSDEKHESMQRQIDSLIERERHQLARVAAHAVWDELMLRKIAALGGVVDIPPPPPLAYEDGIG